LGWVLQNSNRHRWATVLLNTQERKHTHHQLCHSGKNHTMAKMPHDVAATLDEKILSVAEMMPERIHFSFIL
jgi:hypothetical protein